MDNISIDIFISNDANNTQEYYNLSAYDSLEDFINTEFEGKELSDYTIEELGDVPSRLYNKVDLPCTIEDALNNQNSIFDVILDWSNYVYRNPRKKEATEAYIDINYEWNSNHFEDTYMGSYSSEEDFALNYLEETNYEIGNLEDYFDFIRYGGEIREEFSDYTHEALEDYRRSLGLPPLDEDLYSDNHTYGFIGDDEDSESEESEDSYNEEDRERAEQEYQEYVEDHSFEIRMAEIEYDDDLGRTFIDEVYGGVDYLSNDFIREYFDIDSFTTDLFYDYYFENGHVFSNY